MSKFFLFFKFQPKEKQMTPSLKTAVKEYYENGKLSKQTETRVC